MSVHQMLDLKTVPRADSSPVRLCGRRLHDEGTVGPTTITSLLNRRTNKLCNEGLCKPADLRMACYNGGKRTTVPMKRRDSIALFKFYQTTKLIEYLDSSCEPHP